MTNKTKYFTNDERFEYAVSFVLDNEGGFINDKDDGGGETKFGISKRSYPKVNIKSLTIDQAKAIYKHDFWDFYNYNKIDDIIFATKVFDLAVNAGPSWSHKLVQRALQATGQYIIEDGVLGPVTLAAINSADPDDDLLTALKEEAAIYYQTIVDSKPKKAKFLKGWLKRAYLDPETSSG